MTREIETLALDPIGVMHTTYVTKVEAPRQPAATGANAGVIELFADRNLEHAIEDLAGWQRIWVIFWFDRNAGWRPKVLPPRSTTGRKGVLATRAPHRPNPLGLSALRLERIDGLNLHVLDVDLLDGTPILDIKPYVPYTDAFADSGSGWLDAGDPAAAWTVAFADTAAAQLDWLAPRIALPLRTRIEATLALGPQPHPYRRIRREQNGQMRLAVQDWRAEFQVDDRRIEVLRIASGYRESQLAGDAPDPDGTRAVHRAYKAIFG